MRGWRRRGVQRRGETRAANGLRRGERRRRCEHLGDLRALEYGLWGQTDTQERVSNHIYISYIAVFIQRLARWRKREREACSSAKEQKAIKPDNVHKHTSQAV